MAEELLPGHRRDVEGAGGVRLSVRDVEGPSPGAPALLLHHGLASSQRIWDLMLAPLSARFRIVTYDARGHGLSEKPASGFGFDHVVEDLLAVVRATRLRRPVVVGHSWGASVALAAVARHPRSLAGAVLVDGGLVSLASDGATWAETKARLAPPPLAGMPLEEFLGHVRRHLGADLDVTPEIEAVTRSLVRVDGRGGIHPRLSRANHFRILHAIWRQNPAALLPSLRTPALAILATGDGPPTAWARRIAAEAKRAAPDGLLRVSFMRGIHDLPLQHPADLARGIERFASEIVG